MTTRQRIEAEKAGIFEDAAATGAELRRLRAILDHIAESVIVRVFIGGITYSITRGCGICEGESAGYDKPDGRGVYAHKEWCPRKP